MESETYDIRPNLKDFYREPQPSELLWHKQKCIVDYEAAKVNAKESIRRLLHSSHSGASDSQILAEKDRVLRSLFALSCDILDTLQWLEGLEQEHFISQKEFQTQNKVLVKMCSSLEV